VTTENFILPFCVSRKRVEDEIMDMCEEWGSSTHSIELESMHAWTHMFGSRWHSSFWGWVGLVWWGRLILEVVGCSAASGSDWGGAGHGGVRGSRRAGVHRARTTSASKAHGAQGTNPSLSFSSMLGIPS